MLIWKFQTPNQPPPKNMETQEKNVMSTNRLIAEFMGTFSACDNWGEQRDMIIDAPQRVWNVERCKYHKSWDWLIPVCQKCSDISQKQERPNVNACNRIDWLDCEIGVALREMNIKLTYAAVVSFIEYWNKKGE